MTINIGKMSSCHTHHASYQQAQMPLKSKPDTLLLSQVTPTKHSPQTRPKHPDIFSPRPETPAPAQFPFLNSPTPPRHSRATPQPPTPPRPRPRRTRQNLSADDALPRRNGLDLGVRAKTSFEMTLAAFPAPPSRIPSLPFFRSLPASPVASMRLWQNKSSPLGRKAEDKEVEMDSGSDDDSDCRTITGIPATPSTVNSGWDNFWSEVSFRAIGV
jgi:hypothetical protein